MSSLFLISDVARNELFFTSAASIYSAPFVPREPTPFEYGCSGVGVLGSEEVTIKRKSTFSLIRGSTIFSKFSAKWRWLSSIDPELSMTNTISTIPCSDVFCVNDSLTSLRLAGSSAGGCRNYIESFADNPQFLISLEDPDESDDENKCTMIVNLMQKGRRAMRDEGLDLLSVGFAIYALRDEAPGRCTTDFFRYNASCARSKAFINLREVSGRFKLPPGNYLIVPSSFKPDEEGEFILRVFTEKAVSSSEL